MPIIQCLRRFSSCYVEAAGNVGSTRTSHAQVKLISKADRDFFDQQSRCVVAESIRDGIQQDPFNYCVMSGNVRLTRRESAFEIGDEQVTEYNHAVLQGVRRVMNAAMAASKYFATLFSRQLQDKKMDDLDTCFEELKQTFLLNIALRDYFVQSEEVSCQKVLVSAGTHHQIVEVMEKIVLAMTPLPHFYLNELLDAAFPGFITSLERNSEYFAMAKSFLAHEETQAPFIALCLEGLLANLDSLDTEQPAPPLWLELAKLALGAELMEGTASVYCCYLLVGVQTPPHP